MHLMLYDWMVLCPNKFFISLTVRAGPSIGHGDGDKKKTTKKSLKKSQVGTLYRTSKQKGAPGIKVVMTPEGRPLKAGNIAGGGKRRIARQDSL
jgi:hypothetical protein